MQTHEELTLAAIEDTLARGSLPDWAPLVRAIEAGPHREVAEKTLRICTTGDIYGTSKLCRLKEQQNSQLLRAAEELAQILIERTRGF